MGGSPRAELADFLRTRRAQVEPDDVGLARGPRRRAVGLRREEVAQLAGISPTWYAWLEQGREIHPSEHVLAGVARALRLSRAEREHMRALAYGPGLVTPSEAVDVSLREVIDHPGQLAAFVKGPRWDLLACNARAEELFGFSAQPAARGNVVRWFFTAHARSLIVGWEAYVRRDLGIFRADVAWMAGDPRLDELVQELAEEAPEFRAWWQEHPIHARTSGTKELQHPHHGHLMLNFVACLVPQMPGCKTVFFVPADVETETKLKWRAPGSARG